MIIDVHEHAYWHGRDAAGLIADMDQQGIDKAWILTWEIPVDEDSKGFHYALNPVRMRADGTHPGIPLEDIIKAKELYPDRFVLGYCPNPRLETAPQLFEAAVKIHGVRVCGEWKYRIGVDDPRCINLFRKAGELNCPVIVHLDIPYMPTESGEPVYCPGWYGGTVDNLERAMKACPETIFLGHAPGFWREISGDSTTQTEMYPKGKVVEGGKLYGLLDQYENLYLDLSAGSGMWALKRDPEHARKFMIRYADRLLFARDYYGSDLNDFLKTLDLPQDVQDKMYFQNALKLVPLD